MNGYQAQGPPLGSTKSSLMVVPSQISMHQNHWRQCPKGQLRRAASVASFSAMYVGPPVYLPFRCHYIMLGKSVLWRSERYFSVKCNKKQHAESNEVFRLLYETITMKRIIQITKKTQVIKKEDGTKCFQWYHKISGIIQDNSIWNYIV